MTRITFFIVAVLLVLSYSLCAQQPQTKEEQPYPKEVLTGVNSKYMEVRPMISGDGSTLFFGRRNHPDNAGGARDYQDIWVSQYSEASGRWSAPQNLGPVLNNRGRNALASVNADGTEGVFFNVYRRTTDAALVRSRRTAQGWSRPEPLTIQNYVNLNEYADYFLSFRHQVLLLAVEGEETYGGQDLYISLPDGYGGWGTPFNLGPSINTPEADFAPFLGSDGRSLFFCSYGHGGQGAGDIFVSVRLDDSWRRWSAPVNLGPSINTAFDESYFSITDDFNYIYYTSQNPKQENRDIVRAELPDDFTAINGPLLVQLDSKTIRSIMASGNYRVNPQGRTRNFEGVSFEGWPGYVAEGLAGSDPTTDQPDSSAVTIPALAATDTSRMGAEGAARSRFADFRPSAEVNTLSPEAEELRRYLHKQLPGQPLLIRQQGDTVEFKLVENLEYDFNGVYATSRYLPRLRSIGNVLQQRPRLSLQLIGHTDEVGTPEANERVARQRVTNLQAYFRSRGIAASRLETLALGSQEPLADNDTEANRRKNRRVELVIRWVR
ncbi:OmpA family protein [Cesiribacter andamanensis]|uniref:Inner membrane lipoprotein YiaD n=1 Tax=Cesiribacter andamanensis AMV16 TaxID=1279009 RepID=M7N7E1_9BACT|nr:OmpA family protein [Cesiribacter andamanensis]EMR03177.1 Inner membrane lipoprotein YiaD precursor [Cesiribacter andamanensis AMV16]